MKFLKIGNRITVEFCDHEVKINEHPLLHEKGDVITENQNKDIKSIGEICSYWLECDENSKKELKCIIDHLDKIPLKEKNCFKVVDAAGKLIEKGPNDVVSMVSVGMQCPGHLLIDRGYFLSERDLDECEIKQQNEWKKIMRSEHRELYCILTVMHEIGHAIEFTRFDNGFDYGFRGGFTLPGLDDIFSYTFTYMGKTLSGQTIGGYIQWAIDYMNSKPEYDYFSVLIELLSLFYMLHKRCNCVDAQNEKVQFKETQAYKYVYSTCEAALEKLATTSA